MSERRLRDYPSPPSTRDRRETKEKRRPYSGRVSSPALPEPEARREYDTRRYDDGGDRDRQPVRLSGFSAGLPVAQSPSMKFEWNNLLSKKTNGANPTANPGLNRPNFGFRYESDAYSINAERGCGGGSAKSGVSDPGVEPTGKYGYFHGGFTSPLGKFHVGVPKVEDFSQGVHRTHMGQEDKTGFSSGPGFSSGLTDAFRAFPVPDEFNRSRRIAAVGPTALGGYAQGQTTRLNENGEMGTLPILDVPYYKMATGVGEGTRPFPGYLRPTIECIDGVNGSLRAATQEHIQWDQHHHNCKEQTQPSAIPSYQSWSEPSFPDNDEVLGSSSRTQLFGYGGDDGLQRGVQALSYECTLKRLVAVEGDQGLDDMTTLKMCAMRKLALAKKLRRNDSNSLLFHDLGASGNVPDLSYDEIEQYATIREGQLNIDQAVTCGEDQWNIDQAATFREDQSNIDQAVNYRDQRNIDQAVNYGNQWNIDQVVTCREDLSNIDHAVNYGEDQWNVDQDLTFGEDEWNAEDIHTLNSDSLLPSVKLPAPLQKHCGEELKPARVDVKKRLGPWKSSGSIKKRLGPLTSPGGVTKRLGPLKSPGGIKKRLRPAQDVSCLKFLGPKLRDQYKSRIRETDDVSGSIHPQGGGLPKVKEKPAKKELPEDSEEFKKLVNSVFLKYIKILHENPAQRRKFMEGGTFTIKCCVCPSNSKEFAGTVPLAKHAFTSPMVGSRAEHLGFHKALCVLLGWDSAAILNGTWVRRFLPDAEALALKEDVVIWPPVVVIHNSSIANKNPDEKVIVSIEGLEAILRGIGFGRGKTKVCRGRPANQSIMVVAFNATFSGLQEAERLHKLLAENKHGRAEFQQISAAGLNNSSEGNQNVVADEANCLYGYLGIAEDLGKLGIEMKKRCVVKSKKEIQAIAYTSQ